MRGLPTLVAYGRARRQVDVIGEVSQRHRHATMRTLRLAFTSSAALELLASISVAIVAVTVGLRLTHGSMTLNAGLLAILLAPEAYWPIRRVGASPLRRRRGPGGRRHPRRLDDPASPPRVRNLSPEQPVPHSSRIGGADDGGVLLVTCVHPHGRPRPRPLRRHAGCRAGPHRAHRAVGRRQVDPPRARGRAAHAHRRYRAHRPRPPRHAAAVPPGRDAARRPAARNDATDAELWDALRLVGLEGFVASLPSSLATRLGDDGFGLSAGQRARVALARATLSTAPVLLVDEPTAHLDPASAELVHDVLVGLAERRTVIVVTHRPELVARADRHVELTRARAAWRHDAPDRARRAAGWRGHGLRHRPHRDLRLARRAGPEQPVILTLLTAIVAVRAFGIAPPFFRYLERLVSHDAALDDLAARRTAVYAALVPLTPARLGRRSRSPVLSGVVDDLTDATEAQVRVTVPLLSSAVAGLVATLLVAWFSPAVGLVLVGLLLAVTACCWLAWRVESRSRDELLEARAEAVRVSDLVAWQATELQAIGAEATASGWLADAHATLRKAVRRQSRGRALVAAFLLLATAMATLAAAPARRPRRGRRTRRRPARRRAGRGRGRAVAARRHDAVAGPRAGQPRAARGDARPAAGRARARAPGGRCPSAAPTATSRSPASPPRGPDARTSWHRRTSTCRRDVGSLSWGRTGPARAPCSPSSPATSTRAAAGTRSTAPT